MKKFMTREQGQTSQDRGIRFMRYVKKDDDRAQELEDESLDEWAARKGVTLTNPRRPKRVVSEIIHESRGKDMPRAKTTSNPTKEELLERIQELEDENDDLQDQLDQIADIAAPDEDSEEDDDDDQGDDDDSEDSEE